MTTLSKEDIVRWARSAGFSGTHSNVLMADGEDLISLCKLEEFATLARADIVKANKALVAENERLKEMAMFFSTYTDPDELEMDEIENAARESFRRANSGVRGTTITRANSYESHVIWATKARINKEVTAARTALAAAEAREEMLRKAIILFRNEAAVGRASSARKTEGYAAMQYAVFNQPRDTTALNKLLAAVYDECAKVCETSDRYRGDYFAAKLRALAKQKGFM